MGGLFRFSIGYFPFSFHSIPRWPHLLRERSALFTFLYRDATPATNFLAEQALRPAVVNRKMSAGNNTPRGAQAQAVLMTVLHSARKRSVDTMSLLVDALRDPPAVQHLL